jgi:hypothetical protein
MSRTFVSPNGRFTLVEGGGTGVLRPTWGTDGSFGGRGVIVNLGTDDLGWCLVNDTGTLIASASNGSLRLVSSDGRQLQALEVAPHFADRFVGGWLGSDGSSYWETKQGDLLVWRRGCRQLEKVDPSSYLRLFESIEVSPVSCVRMCLAHKVKLPGRWLASHRKQIEKQDDGPLLLQLYDSWIGGASQEKMVHLLAETRRPHEDTHAAPGNDPSKEWLRQPLLPTRLEELCFACESGCLPPWFIKRSDLDELLVLARCDPKVPQMVLNLHALRPDLGVEPELISLLVKYSHPYGQPTPYSNSIRCLEQAEVDPALLCPLLEPGYMEIERLIDYYSYRPCRVAVPRLIELLPLHSIACRRALLGQLRVDLGDDPAAWRTWIAQSHHEPSERGQLLQNGGDAGGQLWLARADERFVTPRAPRLVQRIVAHKPDEIWLEQDRVGLRRWGSPQLDWYWELPSGKSKWPLVSLAKDGYFQGIGLPSGESLVEVQVDGTSGIRHSKKGVERYLTRQELRQDNDAKTLLENFARQPLVRYSTSLAWIFFEGKSALQFGQARSEKPIVKGQTSEDGRWTLVAGRNGDSDCFSLWSIATKDYQLRIAIPRFSSLLYLGSQATFNVPQCFSPDSRWLAIGTEKLTLVSTEGDTPHTVSTQAIKARSLAFQPKAERLAVGSENELVLMHLPDLKVEQIIRGLGPVNGLAYSPDGSLLAVALQDEIRVYQTNSPWPTQEGQDPQLLSELWTGMRLSGGAAVRLSEVEFKQRLKRWKSETGSDWWDGCPKPPGLPTLPLAALAICGGFLGYSFWSRRRS